MKQTLLLAALLLTALPAGAGQPAPKVPDGFRCELLLSAPEIEAPTALCVAPNGDVYFAEDPMDMRGPSNKNNDKIWLLKGGDPKQRILVAEKLWAVIGMEIVRDKLYVVHYPYVSAFTLDAEGKAKERQDLFTDLGPKSAPPGGFNDHVPSGIRMGMDGWLYVSIGDKGIPKMTRKEKDRGSVYVAEGRWRHSKAGQHISLEGGGVIRFRPDGSGLEVFASGTRNHLDVPLDEDDRIFVRDNTDDGDGWNTRFMYLPQGAFMGYPWAFTRHPKETLPMIRDFGGGSPCGGWVYNDDGLPETYRGRVFHCEWGKGKVLAVKVAPNGAGFKYVDEIAFMDPSGTGVKDFRPFTLRPTPDGRAFYVTDWAFSGWSQPVKAGRIWKVSYVKGDVRPALRGGEGEKIEELIRALHHPAHTERLRVQRLLEDALRKYVAKKGMPKVPSVSEPWWHMSKTPAARKHLLWAWHNATGSASVPRAALTDSDASVRAQVARIFGNSAQPELAAFLLRDKAPQVRQQALLAMARSDKPFFFSPNTLPFEDPDVHVRFALVRMLRAQKVWRQRPLRLSDALTPTAFEAILQAHAEVYEVDAVNNLIKGFGEVDSPERRARVVETLARAYKDRKPYAGGWWGTRPEQQKPPARVVAWEGTPLVRDAVLAALADKEAEVRKAAVAGLLAMNDPATLEPLIGQYAKENDPATRTDIVRAVGGLKVDKAGAFLDGILRNAKNPEPLRLEAVRALANIGTPAAAASIARAAGEPGSAALQVTALEALGALKNAALRPAALAALKSPTAAVRKAAAGALGKLGDPTTAAALLPLLADKDAAVQSTALQALGNLKAPVAIPALVKAASESATQFDAVTALTKMPDVRALSPYLIGLASKNADLRKASRQALAAIRDKAAPALEELAKRNELPAAVVAELGSVYRSYAPVIPWKVIGPFPNDGKAYPPEKELRFDAVYKGAGAEVKWRDRKADGRANGKIDLLRLYNPNQNVVAYGYAEIDSATDREATLQVGSDDSIVIWLNSKKVHEYPGTRAWKHDADTVKVSLKKGKNALLLKCGQQGGDWAFSVGVSGETGGYAFLKGGVKKFDLESFRAHARKQRGDTERGRRLFFDLKGLACAKCHAVGGTGGKVGPDLAGIGLRYKREDLITSILEPSKQIANGYETVVVTTADGKQLIGVFKGETGDAVSLMDAEGKLHTVAKKDIEDRRISPISTMPNGLSDGMTLQDFADLVAFLEARREDTSPPRKGKARLR